MKGVLDIVSDGYKELFGISDIQITALPQSGSDRKYFRIMTPDGSVIGAYNPNPEENEAFIGFTNHFISKGLPVPEIYRCLPEKNVYFLQDLGDLNLFTFLQNKHANKGFDDESENIYQKVLDKLIEFQIKGIDGLNLDLCYPHRSFDRQSMMWDMKSPGLLITREAGKELRNMMSHLFCTMQRHISQINRVRNFLSIILKISVQCQARVYRSLKDTLPVSA